MRSIFGLFCMALAVFISLTGVQPVQGQVCTPCEALADADFGPNVTIASAGIKEMDNPVEGEDPIEYCEIKGVRFYDPFIVKLPTAWNGNFYQTGNGGDAGGYQESAVDAGLLMGYAAASGSGGWDKAINPDPLASPMFAWAYPQAYIEGVPSSGVPPVDPDMTIEEATEIANQKLVGYAYESVHETALLAKKMVSLYYCKKPQYSYYNSCSTGGRQGLMEAQRYPEDFDGLLIGAPVHELSRITQRGVWENLALSGPGLFPAGHLSILADAVMKKCDSIDGLVDGLINDPYNCNFDALADLPACPDDIAGDGCFTQAQRQAVKNIYDGPAGGGETSGEAYGSEAIIPGSGSGWNLWVYPIFPPFVPSLGMMLGGGFVQYVGLPPSGYGGSDFDFSAFYTADENFPEMVVDNTSQMFDAIDPDLRAFKKSGGKIIHYDGWADPATGPYQTVEYYEDVLERMGQRKTNDFYKLYMIPGMAHCGGGLGCFDNAALFNALVEWVENGDEPTDYTGAGISAAGDPRTRPMCPYPQVARYLGEGSIDEAQNFSCVSIVPAKVEIMPKTINLDTDETFTTYIHLPPGYQLSKRNDIIVVTEGAKADTVKRIRSNRFKGKFKKFHRVKKYGDTYIARFDIQDLKNIDTGENITFTVSAIMEHKGKNKRKLKGKTISFEGSNTICVLRQ